jgi:hypothetical protein
MRDKIMITTIIIEKRWCYTQFPEFYRKLEFTGEEDHCSGDHCEECKKGYAEFIEAWNETDKELERQLREDCNI